MKLNCQDKSFPRLYGGTEGDTVIEHLALVNNIFYGGGYITDNFASINYSVAQSQESIKKPLII